MSSFENVLIVPFWAVEEKKKAIYYSYDRSNQDINLY